MNRGAQSPEAVFRRIETIWALEPDAQAVEFGDAAFSWGDLRSAVSRIDAALTEAGVGHAARALPRA